MAQRPQWDPFHELQAVQKRMNQLFESALARSNFETSVGLDAWIPVADVYESQDGLVVDLELPGIERAAIDVRIEGGELVVGGERRMEGQSGEQYHRVERSYGRFTRHIPLPAGVDVSRVQASYRHGVLQIVLPMAGGDRVRTRRVEVD
jgi:HSP20 family protein